MASTLGISVSPFPPGRPLGPPRCRLARASSSTSSSRLDARGQGSPRDGAMPAGEIPLRSSTHCVETLALSGFDRLPPARARSEAAAGSPTLPACPIQRTTAPGPGFPATLVVVRDVGPTDAAGKEGQSENYALV